MRIQALADALGVDRKAIRHQVSDRQTLLALMALDRFAESSTEVIISRESWRQDASRICATAFTGSLIAADTLAEHLRLDESLLARYGAATEAVLKKMLAAGFTEEVALRSIALVTISALGSPEMSSIGGQRGVLSSPADRIRKATERQPVTENLAVARIFLFVPGDRPDRFGKAAASGADVVILDLEDAVAADQKREARENVRAWLVGGNQAAIRINGDGTPWKTEDVVMIAELPGPVAAVMVPKAESAERLTALSRALPAGTGIIPLIETAAGILHAAAADLPGSGIVHEVMLEQGSGPNNWPGHVSPRETVVASP